MVSDKSKHFLPVWVWFQDEVLLGHTVHVVT